MIYVYKLKLWFRHFLYRLFGGPTPAWLSDAWDQISNVNVLNLLPTVLMIGLDPRHFFSRIDLITEKRPSGAKQVMHSSPVSFAISVATLVLAATWISKKVPAIHLSHSLLWTVFLTFPVLIPAICVVFVALMLIVLWISASSVIDTLLSIFLSKRLKRSLWHRVDMMIMYVAVPLLPSTYRNLNYRRMGWSVFYLYGYFICGPLFILLPLGFVLMPFANRGLHHPWHALRALFEVGGAGGTLMLLVPIYFLVRFAIYPYTQALLMSLKMPTGAARRIEMDRFTRSDILLAQSVNTLEFKRRKPAKIDRIIGNPEASCIRELKRYQKVWSRFNGPWLRYTTRYRLSREEAPKEYERLVANCPHFRGFGLSLIEEEIGAEHIAGAQAAMRRGPTSQILQNFGRRVGGIFQKKSARSLKPKD